MSDEMDLQLELLQCKLNSLQHQVDYMHAQMALILADVKTLLNRSSPVGIDVKPGDPTHRP